MTNLGDTIRILREQGKKYREISEQLGCSKSIISYHLNPYVKSNAIAHSRKSRKAKEAWLRKYKEETPCTDCGSKYEHFLMDFDHLPEHVKLGDISKFLWSVGWDKLKEEIAKCELVCCMCHRRRSWSRQQEGSSELLIN